MGLNEENSGRLKNLIEVDRVIHEPARLMLMTILYVLESADFVFLMNQTGLTWGNLSSHMNKLEHAGYVHVEKKFVGRKPQTMLNLTDSGREAFDAYRQQMKWVFDDLS